MKKRIFALVLAAALVQSLSAGISADAASGAQSATATAPGYEETVTVTITVEDGKITAVEASTDREGGLGQDAIDAMPQEMVEQNTVNVDGVSGATGTSDAILAAHSLHSHQWLLLESGECPLFVNFSAFFTKIHLL